MSSIPNILNDLFAIVAPVFICAGIGFIWAKRRHPYDVELVTALMSNIGTPCLVFHTLTSAEINPDLFGFMALMAGLAIGGFALVSGLLLIVTGNDLRTYLPPLMFSNAGNMGLPLCLLAFGDEGLALAIAFFSVSVVGQFTIGTMIFSGTLALHRLARMPILYAVGAAVVLMVLDQEPPAVIANTMRILGGMTIPMMLITLGVSLASLRVAALPRSTLFSLLRLGMGFAVGFGLAEAFQVEGLQRGVLIVQSAMPVAVFNYLFAQRYRRAPEEVAGMVVISTALSFASLPLLMWYVL